MTVFKQISNNFLSSRDTSELPLEVKASLSSQIRANEVLVRILQLALVLFFAAVYFASPKTSPDDAFEVVPIVLGIYFVFSAFGLYWSLRYVLPDWAVYGSIFLDFGLLFGLLVSFHFQYMQPASFILKAPTLLYVFIFIALRALRLESRFVIAAGLVAICGWAMVIIYVTSIDTGDNMLTRSYVTYLTSNSILIGAEIDKIISIAAVTGILVLVVNGANHLLITSAAETSAARELSRFFDDKVALDIRNHAGELQAGQGVRRTTTIMNVDVRGFTKLADKADPSQVMAVLAAYQGRVLPVIARHQGTIDKFMGDGIMAVFGTSDDQTYAAKQALDATEEILRDALTWASDDPVISAFGPLPIGVGLESGVVAHGAVGQEDRLEFTVIGPAVNHSAKLEKHNKIMNSRCVVSKNCWDIALAEGYTGSLVPSFFSAELDGVEGLENIVVLELPETIQIKPVAPDTLPSSV